MQNKDITSFENLIEYSFENKDLLKQALTHSSYANEMKINRLGHYERLEFLGDAVLEMVSSRFLYDKYPEKSEGELSKMRASMVCEPSLAFLAREFSLEDYILLGKGEEVTGGRNRDSIISDVMEAVIGALYLDGGIDVAEKYIYRFVLNDIENKRLFFDSKTILQELVQANRAYGELKYVPIEEFGPDHDKQFSVNVQIGDVIYGNGVGRSKKAAEQQAAYKALLAIKQS